MKRYHQLTREQRYQIYALKKAGCNQSEIATVISAHKSTVSRELRRNRGGRGYRPKQAQQLMQKRRRLSHLPRICSTTWKLIESLVEQDWSPEQVSGWLFKEHCVRVSHERIYQHIYGDKTEGGMLYQHLRCQKKRRKRYGSYSRRGQMPGCRSIDKRPKIVEARSRLGDWEADTIIGRQHKEALVSLVERKSRLVLLKKVARKTAGMVEQAIIELLAAFSGKVHTLTSDNGREFANHQQIAAHLKARFYFAHPFAAWERGTNENANGLVRQYFSKNCDFTTITDAEVEQVMQRLNTRPRKTLGFRTPQQVFFKQSPVALQC